MIDWLFWVLRRIGNIPAWYGGKKWDDHVIIATQPVNGMQMLDVKYNKIPDARQFQRLEQCAYKEKFSLLQ